MTPDFLFKGMAVGFSVAAPVGPIGVLCIRRSLAEGRWIGFATGLGAATADTLYGVVAAFGLTAISGFLLGHKPLLAVLGGLFLCALGMKAFFSRPPGNGAEAPGSRMSAAYLSTLLLTISNPATILSFLAVFAGFGLGSSTDYRAAGAMVAGVFLGSALWWLVLSSGAALLKGRLSEGWMRGVNRLSGCTLLGFGLYAVWTGLA